MLETLRDRFLDAAKAQDRFAKFSNNPDAGQIYSARAEVYRTCASEIEAMIQGCKVPEVGRWFPHAEAIRRAVENE